MLLNTAIDVIASEKQGIGELVIGAQYTGNGYQLIRNQELSVLAVIARKKFDLSQTCDAAICMFKRRCNEQEIATLQKSTAFILGPACGMQARNDGLNWPFQPIPAAHNSAH